MSRVAFFVDGNFLYHRIKLFKSFFVNGPNVREYCLRHLRDGESLYRIFYYDSPALDRTGIKPFGTVIDFRNSKLAEKKNSLLSSIVETPNMALRLGKASWQNDWLICEDKLKEIKENGNVTFTDDDFYPNIKQKAVDMKIGLDIATITFKRLADRIVIIAGDSDFAPAAKLARVEGVHVTLDPLGNNVPDDLLSHIDDMDTKLDVHNNNDVDPNKRHFFIACRKKLP